MNNINFGRFLVILVNVMISLSSLGAAGDTYTNPGNQTSGSCHEPWPLDTIAGTSFDAAESGPPPLHSVRCPDHFCLESFPQELEVRRSKMH